MATIVLYYRVGKEMATPPVFTGDSTVSTMFSQPSKGPDPHHDPEEDPEEEESRLKELRTDNILPNPDQQKDTPLPSSSLRSIGSTCSHDHLVSSPVSPCLHQPEHDNVSIDVSIDNSKSIGTQKRDEVLPEILSSNSDGEEEANDIRNKVTENKVDDSASSKLVVESQKFPFNFDKMPCNLDVTISYTPSMTSLVSSEGTSDLVVHTNSFLVTLTTLSTVSTLSTGSDVLKEEDIENIKYNTKMAPVHCSHNEYK